MSNLTKWTELRNELIYNQPMHLIPLLTRSKFEQKMVFTNLDIYDNQLFSVRTSIKYEQQQEQTKPFVNYIYKEISIGQFGNIQKKKVNLVYCDPESKSVAMSVFDGVQGRLINRLYMLEVIFTLQSTDPKIQKEIILSFILVRNILNSLDKQQVDEMSKKRIEIVNMLKEGKLENLLQQASQVKQRHYIDRQMVSVFKDSQIDKSGQELQLQSLAQLMEVDIIEIQLLYFLSQSVFEKGIQNSIKRLLNNPIDLSKKTVQMQYPWKDFIIQPKADGIRALFIGTIDYLYLLFENQLIRVQENVLNQIFVIESEVVDKHIFCYDIHYMQAIGPLRVAYLIRLRHLEELLVVLNSHKLDNYQVSMKQFTHLTKDMNQEQLKTSFLQIKEQEYNTDGLIINSNELYSKQQIYKWKPEEFQTIDFYCKILTSDQAMQHLNKNDENETYYGLFSPISIRDLEKCEQSFVLDATIQTKLILFTHKCIPNPAYLTDVGSELDEQIVECLYNKKTKQWKLVKIRTDKGNRRGEFGNYITVAQRIVDNILDFPPFSCLYEGVKASYFEIQRDPMYNNMTQYVNLIKNRRICQIANFKQQQKKASVLDLGSGKGQDLMKYVNAGFSRIYLVEVDDDAIQELKQRILGVKHLNVDIQVFKYDLRNHQSCIELSSLLTKNNITSINLNLCIHYFMENQSLFDVLFAQFAGIVHISFVNGEKLFNMFKQKEDIRKIEQGKVKYQYQKQYSELVQWDIGQYYLTKLPFQQKLISELLVNPKYLTKLMNQAGFDISNSFDMGDLNNMQYVFSKDEMKGIISQFHKLNHNDQFHVSLFSSFMFIKRI